MLKVLKYLTISLNEICPTFTQVPPQTAYPYISLEADKTLQGLPWGPCIANITVKIWSRYAGTQEILKLAKSVEAFLCKQAVEISLKILESSLVLLKDGQTRVHSFHLKARIPYVYH